MGRGWEGMSRQKAWPGLRLVILWEQEEGERQLGHLEFSVPSLEMGPQCVRGWTCKGEACRPGRVGGAVAWDRPG